MVPKQGHHLLGLNIPFLAVQTLCQSKSNYSMISTCGNEFDFHNGLPETDIFFQPYLEAYVSLCLQISE
jgi:hypothetical protein